jgi:ribosomal protein L29
MKKTSYKDKSKQDLVKALRERRDTLRKLRFGSTGSKVRNVKGRMSTRKDIARIMTELASLSRSGLNKIK